MASLFGDARKVGGCGGQAPTGPPSADMALGLAPETWEMRRPINREAGPLMLWGSFCDLRWSEFGRGDVQEVSPGWDAAHHCAVMDLMVWRSAITFTVR